MGTAPQSCRIGRLCFLKAQIAESPREEPLDCFLCRPNSFPVKIYVPGTRNSFLLKL